MTKTDTFKLKLIAVMVPLLFTASAHVLAADKAQILTVYIDPVTEQIYSGPGPNRVKIGDFQAVTAKSATAVDPQDVKVKLDQKGLKFETADEQFKFSVGGRLHADATYHSNDRLLKSGDRIEANDGTEIRRARIDFKGTLWSVFNFQAEADFADNEVGMKDLFLNYTGWDFADITVGNQKQNISMELQESSNDIMFTERSLVNSLTGTLFDRAIGLNLKKSDKNWSVQGGIYGDSMRSNRSNSNKGSGKADEGFGASTRWTFAPINSSENVIHIGGFAGYRTTNGKGELNDNSPSFGYETTHMSNLKLTDTGTIVGIEEAKMVGLELAAMHGPFSIQSEYSKVKVQREKSLASLDFNAFYVQAGWTLTGESRTYKGSDGEFKRFKPKNRFQVGKPGLGALELAVRYDQNDLTDKDVKGGSEKRATLALNWYMSESVRLMADYSRSFDIKGSPVTKLNGDQPDNIDVLTFRTQWAF
ncbi:OprO/OprP family phosphate-selective porin [Candidatus Nitrotoga sp. BS]|uniref:OprO/OprP family phosphate-selective porin n=1 Tax=Candidatus Nitrotoga sp. BS TaxID=2890408 RepID=UPI001EF1FE48|nr:porin [Candidatus Nitrotoga sp. BS]